MASNRRRALGFYVIPPELPNAETMGIEEEISPKILWLLLDQLMKVPQKGRALFSGPLSDRNRLWREFSNYLRQARAYWDAATGTVGSSSALLYYYAFLNLAKAELLTSAPFEVVGRRVHHGLSYSPTKARSIRGDQVTTGRGVFPMLYQKRTGGVMSNSSSLGVTRLLGLVPEIGLELAESGYGMPTTVSAYHCVAGDSQSAWVLLCTPNPGFLTAGNHAVGRAFRSRFTEVGLDDWPNWREFFALSRRTRYNTLCVLQSIATFSQVNSDGLRTPDYYGAAMHLRAEMGPYVSNPIQAPVDAFLTPGLFRGRRFPMPVELARYALMFYLSSLVRYKPSMLDPVHEATNAWLFDSFARETPLRMLGDAVCGILGRPLVFEANGFRV